MTFCLYKARKTLIVMISKVDEIMIPYFDFHAPPICPSLLFSNFSSMHQTHVLCQASVKSISAHISHRNVQNESQVPCARLCNNTLEKRQDSRSNHCNYRKNKQLGGMSCSACRAMDLLLAACAHSKLYTRDLLHVEKFAAIMSTCDHLALSGYLCPIWVNLGSAWPIWAIR